MDEETIPLEAGIESRAISLTKGCYVGQEVIIRVLHRGHGRVARKLVGLREGRRRHVRAGRDRADGRPRHRRGDERRMVASAAAPDRARLRASRFRRTRNARDGRWQRRGSRRSAVCSEVVRTFRLAEGSASRRALARAVGPPSRADLKVGTTSAFQHPNQLGIRRREFQADELFRSDPAHFLTEHRGWIVRRSDIRKNEARPVGPDSRAWS